MIKIYVALIRKNKLSIDDVPESIREKVKEIIEADKVTT